MIAGVRPASQGIAPRRPKRSSNDTSRLAETVKMIAIRSALCPMASCNQFPSSAGLAAIYDWAVVKDLEEGNTLPLGPHGPAAAGLFHGTDRAPCSGLHTFDLASGSVWRRADLRSGLWARHPTEMLNATLRADFPQWGGRMLLNAGYHLRPGTDF